MAPKPEPTATTTIMGMNTMSTVMQQHTTPVMDTTTTTGITTAMVIPTDIITAIHTAAIAWALPSG
jgi:hypothetical protein